MKLDTLKKYISMGREIEFAYDSEIYSITYSFEKNVQTIYFSHFDHSCTDYSTIENFIDSARIGEEYLRDILGKLEDIIVY